MANELNIDLGPTRTGLTVTATLILNGSTVGSPVSLTETTTGFYSGNMPAVASGVYSVRFLSSGSFVGDGLISWDGTAERTLLNLPTVAQLEARTLPTADYFNPSTDTVATVTSVTNAVVLPTIPANWITATGIASNAITSTKIAANAIGATQIASAAITSAKLATDAITADKVATDAVTEIQSGLATAASVAAIPTNPLLTTDARLNNLDTTISSRSTFNAAIDAVIVGTNNDKTGYVLTQAFPANFAALGINASGHVSRVTLVDTTTTNTDMRGTDGALTSLGSVAPLNWINADAIATDAVTEIQSGLATASSVAAIPTNPLLTTDARLNTLDAAISTRLASTDYTTPPTASANATAVRTELSVELARIDANISTRSTYDGIDTTGTTTLLSRLTEIRAGYLDAAISSRLAAISYTEPLTILQTANAVTDALVAYPVPTLAQTQAAGFTTERHDALVATEAAAKAVADGRHVIDYLNSIATQYEADGTVRTVFDLLDQDGNPATTAQAAVERVPQ